MASAGPDGFDDGIAAMHHEKPRRLDRAAIVITPQTCRRPEVPLGRRLSLSREISHCQVTGRVMVSAMLTRFATSIGVCRMATRTNFAASVRRKLPRTYGGQHLTATGYQARVFCSRAEALDVPQIVHVHVVTACLDA